MKFFSKLFSFLKPKVAEGRSPKWPKIRTEHIKQHNKCSSCGKKTKLNVHHIRPVHLYPELELEPTNLITLCENTSFNCHFVCGHLMNWLAWNPTVIDDAANLNYKIINRVDFRV